MAKVSSDSVSLVIIVHGHRGAGKTLFLTANICRRLIKNYYLQLLYNKESHVWTNFPVGFYHHCMITDKVVYLEAEPLNMEAFYTLSDDFCNGWAYFSELDQWYDRQEWATTSQKLMNKVLTQIRKKKMNIMADLQNVDWLNSRGLFQTDLICKVREAAFSGWGRKVGLGLGEASYLVWRNHSGVLQGFTYEESGQELDEIFWGRHFWNCYDTDKVYNPLENVKYKLELRTKVIKVGGDDVYATDMESPQKNPDLVLISQAVSDLRDDGFEDVERSVLWARLHQMGYEGTPRDAGILLTQLGITRASANRYSLKTLPMPYKRDKPLSTPIVEEAVPA